MSFESDPTRDQVMVQGDTKTFVFTLTDSAGDPVDLSNVTIVTLTAKTDTKLPDSRAIFEVVGSVDAPATAGICRASIVAADSATPGKFEAELQLVFSSGAINRDMQFNLEIKPRVRVDID